MGFLTLLLFCFTIAAAAAATSTDGGTDNTTEKISPTAPSLRSSFQLEDTKDTNACRNDAGAEDDNTDIVPKSSDNIIREFFITSLRTITTHSPVLIVDVSHGHDNDDDEMDKEDYDGKLYTKKDHQLLIFRAPHWVIIITAVISSLILLLCVILIWLFVK